MLILRMHDDEDPYGHMARATQRDESRWDVEYFRAGVLVSEGGIRTPPPHAPPTAALIVTLRQFRQEADYWAAHPRAEE